MTMMTTLVVVITWTRPMMIRELKIIIHECGYDSDSFSGSGGDVGT